MTQKISHSGLSVLPRLATAGLLILTVGTAVAIGAEGAEAARSSDDVDRPTRRVATQSAKTARVASVDQSKRAESAKPVPGGVSRIGLRNVKLRDPNMSVDEAIRLATQRAVELRNRRLAGSPSGATPGGAAGPPGNGSTAVVPGSSGRRVNENENIGPGSWDNGENFPGMGVGSAMCTTTDYTEGVPGTRSFVDMSTIRRWPELPLAYDAPDLDGDGEPEDPLFQRPTVIYYAFLEESMINFDWDAGEDLMNKIGLPTEDTNGDTIVDLTDDITPGEVDSLADTWTTPGVVVDIIPPPDPNANLDALVILALDRMGLGPWADERPVFRAVDVHPDAEAVWRLYQRTMNPNVEYDLFQDTFDSSLVLEPEERTLFLEAFAAIESVCNVVFIERPDELSDGGLSIGYPFAPQGYTLDSSGLLVNPGTFYPGDRHFYPVVAGDPGDHPGNPDDDYPWFLITKEDNGNYATEIGAIRNRGGSSLTSIDYLPLVDIDLDGFPDTPDLSPTGPFINGNPDQIILSSFGTQTDAIILDLDGDGDVDADDSSISTGVLDIALPSDVNGDGAFDILIDVDSDGVPGVVSFFPTADTNGDGVVNSADASDLQYDFDGDLSGDSVFGNSFASPVYFPFETVPCERLNVNPEVLENGNVGVLVHEIMHHMGFNHEHQRPDREAYVHVNLEHVVPAFASQFTILPGGNDRYANFIDNFDTTTTPLDPTASPPYSEPIAWEVSAGSPAPTSGAWDEQDPSATGNTTPESPQEDFAVDAQDESLECWVTGAGMNEDLDGVTILTSPDFDPVDASNLRGIYGPDGAVVSFAYWLASDQPGDLDPGDGLVVEYSVDGRATWKEAVELRDNDPSWREAQFTIEFDNPNSLLDMDFHIRFIASDLPPDNVIEVGIDRVRVQNTYDFDSIMHYATYAISINPGVPGYEVIEVRPPNDTEYQNRIGQTSGLSDGDRLAIMNLYGEPPDPIDGSNNEPCRADLNGDGIIDNFDMMLFLEWFEAGDPRADFAPEECTDTNGDNVIDINDDTSTCIDVFDMLQYFIDFQNRFECISGDGPVGFNNFGDVNPG